jgi:hypothetical protein
VSELLRDVLEIPRTAGAEDYVLRLTDGVDDKEIAKTIDQYVVTDSLIEAFDKALGLVAEPFTSGKSRGAFLSGSFGSGKSHFMAVLYALLRQERVAREKRELQPVVNKHDEVLRDKKILPLAFHLLGKESMEAALFKGYIEQIEKLHPGAPLPALHLSDGIIADADTMLANAGAEVFFAGLNGGAGSQASAPADRWGGLLGADIMWTAESYASAKAAAPGTEQRQKLVTALASKYFSSYTQQAGYVDLDAGLAAISQHAKGLGYDAVVLFLDELVLWLAFAVQDREFFRRESQKLTTLVEAGTGPRAIPLISFVARQLDLRRWVAEAGATGDEQEALEKAFGFQQGRFGTIVLGDTNLSVVARKRLLRRREDNPRAGQVLQDAFDRIDRKPGIWDVLLDGVNTDEQHRGSSEEEFRRTYPFSPALVSTLRDLASVMQRERTALKVMQQMLVDRRDTLTVDDVVPVGDSFDYIVAGSQASPPLDDRAAALFRAAEALYRDKLRPLILTDNGLTEETASAPGPAGDAFRGHDRLAKTLLLSAVAPRVPALKELTASRLASLNHGSIVAPLPGREAGIVMTKIRQWSPTVPEIHIGDDPRNPVIRVQLSDVDYESVVEHAKGEHNDGRQKELIRDMVREALGVAESSPDLSGVYQHQVTWRGSQRPVELVFANIRDTSWFHDDHLRAGPGAWRFVIDFPFDEPGFSTTHDLERLESVKDRGARERVIAWLPRFLSADRMRDVRRLVILNYLLTGTGEHWRKHSSHLSEVDREQAKAILSSHQRQLRDGLRRAIQQAYGAATVTAGALAEDSSDNPFLFSLDPAFSPAKPVGADLGAAFGNLVSQAFSATYPAHPRFEPSGTPVAVRELSAVYAHVERAVAAPDHWVSIEGDVTAVRRVSTPLGVGTGAETRFLFGDDRFTPWASEFERAATRDGVQPQAMVTVAQVRRWIDDMEPKWGLRDEVADLVILAWAALRVRTWYQYGAPITAPAPGRLRPEMELRPEQLPGEADWKKAVRHAAGVFGEKANPYLTPSAVADLTKNLRAKVADWNDGAQSLVPAVEGAYGRLGLAAGIEGRLVTAKAIAELLTSLQDAGEDRVGLIKKLADAELPGTDVVQSKSLTTAAEVASALNGFQWGRLGPLQAEEGRQTERGRDARDILDALRDALRSDEFASALRPALRTADNAAFAWVAAGISTSDGGGTGTGGGGTIGGGTDGDTTGNAGTEGRGSRGKRSGSSVGTGTRAKGSPAEAVLAPLREFLRVHADEDVDVEWRTRP